MPGAPEALGATTSNTATIAAIGGRDAERVELVEAICGQVQPSDGQVVIDAPDNVSGGEAVPTWESRPGQGGGRHDLLRL